jgi:hypothetical protein
MNFPPADLAHTPPRKGVEATLTQLDLEISAAGRDVTAIAKILERLSKAAAVGDIAVLGKLLKDIETASIGLKHSLTQLASFGLADIDVMFHDETYFKDIEGLARAQNLSGVRATEGKLFAYPNVVERKKSGIALQIGTKTLRNIRPRTVIRALIEARERANAIDRTALLAAVERVYDLLLTGKETNFVSIEDIYGVLTSLPGSDRQLSFLDFLILLDSIRRDGSITTRSGRVLDFPPPSTTGKGGKAFRVIREDGREQLYHMIRLNATKTVAETERLF